MHSYIHTQTNRYILTQDNVEKFVDKLSGELDADGTQVNVDSSGSQQLLLLGWVQSYRSNGRSGEGASQGARNEQQKHTRDLCEKKLTASY